MTAEDLEQRLGIALARHYQGDLAGAIAAYENLLKQAPDHVSALVNLAAALKAAGKPDAALARLRAALAVDDSVPQLWFNYANLLRDQGDTGEAEDAYRRALALDPHLYPAIFNLGNLLRDAGRVEEAERCYRDTLRLKPDFARAYMNLGNLLRAAGRAEDAVAAHRQAVVLASGDADAHYNLGNALADAGAFEAAAASYADALRRQPRHDKALLALGVVLHRLRRVEQASACWQRLVQQDPRHVEARFHLGSLYREMRQIENAVAQYREAQRLAPDRPEIPITLASTLLDSGHVGEALALLEPLLARHPDLAELYKSLGNARVLAAQVDAGLACYETALKHAPQDRSIAANLLFASLYRDWPEPAALSDRHRAVAAGIAANASPAFVTARRGGDRPLRVGYLSADLRSHPVGFFMEPLFACHNPKQVQVSCYYVGAGADETTSRLKSLITRWRDAYAWSDEQLGEQIIADGVDILVDLIGHTGKNRAGLLARKPAPVQALYLGYPCTLGLATVDFLIGDNIVSPPAYRSLYSENIIALDGSFLCFRPPVVAPPVAPPPLAAKGVVTFGSFNHLPKVSPRARALWARVLHAVPCSRLVLKALSLADAGVREQLLAAFAALGITSERIDLLPPSTPLAVHLQDYARIDIGLDPVPYTASTTTCQALWMGVPVVTLAGCHFHERMGASVLYHAGLPELVADTEDDYVNIAVVLAADRERLGRLRTGLRQQLRSAPLCDELGHAARLGDAYRRMWQDTML